MSNVSVNFTDTNLPIQIYQYEFTDTDLPIRMYRYDFTDTNLPIHVYRYMFTNKEVVAVLLNRSKHKSKHSKTFRMQNKLKIDVLE